MWLVFIAGACFGAIVLGLVVAPHMEDAAHAWFRGYIAFRDDARAGLIPGVIVLQVVKDRKP